MTYLNILGLGLIFLGIALGITLIEYFKKGMFNWVECFLYGGLDVCLILAGLKMIGIV